MVKAVRPSRRFVRRATRYGLLGTVLAIAIAIVGFHSHLHSHGDLTVRDANGNSVTVKEWRLGASPSTVEGELTSGDLNFTLNNTDNVAHDFEIVRTDTDPAALPTKGNQVDVSALGTTVGGTTTFNPGQSGTLTFDLPPGTYVLFCNQPGHYQQGMYYQFTVN